MTSIIGAIADDIRDGKILDPELYEKPQDFRLKYVVNGRPFERYDEAERFAKVTAEKLNRSINIYQFVKSVKPSK